MSKRPRSFSKNGAGFRSGEQRESGGRSISMVGKRFQGLREISAREVTRARSASPRARLARSEPLHNTSSGTICVTNEAIQHGTQEARHRRDTTTSETKGKGDAGDVQRQTDEEKNLGRKPGVVYERGEMRKNGGEIRLVGRVARTHARIVFRVQLVVPSPVSLCLFLLCQPPFPSARVTEQPSTGLGGQTRMSHSACSQR